MEAKAIQQNGDNGSLLIVAQRAVAKALIRACEEDVELRKLVATKLFTRILCVDTTDEAESAARRDNIRLALIHASLRGDQQIAPDGVGLLKRMRLIHKARFPVIVLSFDRALAAKEPIFEYPKELQLKRGHYFLPLPCFLQDLQRVIEKSEPLESYQLQTVVYYYCSILDFVRKKTNSIQHDLQHLKTAGDKKRERDKYFKELGKHIDELENAVGEKFAIEMKAMRRPLGNLIKLGSRFSPSDVDSVAGVIGKNLSSVDSVLRRKP